MKQGVLHYTFSLEWPVSRHDLEPQPEIPQETVERVFKGCWSVVFKEKMPNPCCTMPNEWSPY